MTAASGFTFEDGLGVVFRDDRRGCPVWYMAQDYDRAHDEAGDLQPGRHWTRNRTIEADLVLAGRIGVGGDGHGGAQAWITSQGIEPGNPWQRDDSIRAHLVEPGITYRRIQVLNGVWGAPLGTPDPALPNTMWIDLGAATTGE